jgi:hypothetical protein
MPCSESYSLDSLIGGGEDAAVLGGKEDIESGVGDKESWLYDIME